MHSHNRIYLSNTDRKIAGVCGGIAEAFGIDATLLRLAVVFLALITAVFPVVVTYIVAWLIIPEAPKENNNGTVPLNLPH
jgi:phage shock protein PspC (stress-responsive transcriptional regulator)